MSTLFSPDSTFLQRFLSSGGFYNDRIDGDVGPNTLEALGKFETETQEVANDLGSFDKTTEAKIGTMLVPTQRKAREFMKNISQADVSPGLSVHIISGTRTYDEQDELFAQGRTKPGKRVTNARGGFSNHNFGLAFDVTIFKGSTDPEKAKTPVFESPVYKAIGALGTELGLEWGGNWKTIVDEPHFQLRPAWAADLSEREMLADLRERKDSGKDFFARRLGQSQVSRRQV